MSALKTLLIIGGGALVAFSIIHLVFTCVVVTGRVFPFIFVG